MTEKKISLKEIIEGYSDLISAHAKLAGTYKHPTGIGDGREDALIDVIRQIIPDHLAANKCTIIDAQGNATAEFDIVIFEKSHCLTPLIASGRKVIPVESVYAVIEVKSKLDKDAYEKFLAAICSLDRLTRFYEPTGYHPPQVFTQQHRETLRQGIKPQQRFPLEANMPRIGHIISSIFCYDAVASEEIAQYLGTVAEGLTWICVHERELISKWTSPEGFKSLPIGCHSTGLFIWQLLTVLSGSQRPHYYRPNFQKYHDNLTPEIFGEHGVAGWTIEYQRGE